MASGLFINSGCLFGIAKQAYDRAKQAAIHDRSHESQEPMISIIFAAATGEAFINEITELASRSSGFFGPEPDQVKNLASLLSEVEDARGTPNLKFLLGKVALTGQPFDKGSNPYQDFALLVDLRNSLMHLKFDRIESVEINKVRIQHPAIIDKLRSRNILAQFEDESTIASWMLLVSTPAVAKWACNATAGIVKDIVESIPASELRETADLLYVKFEGFAPLT